MARARTLTNLDPQAPTALNARLTAQERLQDMYAYRQFVDNPDAVQELHNLRIATKRVRYTLEVFHKYLPESSGAFADELTQLQDELGALHDSEVMLALLRLALQEASTASPTAQEEQDLLSPRLAASVSALNGGSAAPTQRERRGLLSFLQYQEQRREKCYATFRNHWERLEQRAFYTEFLRMLEE